MEDRDMSAPAPAPTPAPAKSGGWLKAGIVGVFALGSGIAGTYATQVVNSVIKPGKPVANFSVAAEGLTVSCQNQASGESGWWDFGDGTSLVPFAADQSVTHTYTKPGSYTVKLTVRNFLRDENERSVPVEVATGPKELPAPLITGFAVTPVGSSSMAPATFRVTGDVVNAEHCVWDFGDGRVEVADGGKIDRMVTFDKPGQLSLSLVAHSGKQAVKQAAAVKIDAAPAGTLMAVLRVIDSGNEIKSVPRNASVAIPVPTGKNAPVTFSKPLQARPGFTIAKAAPAIDRPIAGVKSYKLEIAPDKHSVMVTGEWAGDAKSAGKAAGGSDVIIPVKLVEERVTAMPPAMTHVTGMVAPRVPCILPLPQAPPGSVREYQLEIKQASASGPSAVVARAPMDAKGTIKFPWSAPSGPYRFSATLEGDKVVVTVVGP
jgi:PKD domain-containing protein